MPVTSISQAGIWSRVVSHWIEVKPGRARRRAHGAEAAHRADDLVIDALCTRVGVRGNPPWPRRYRGLKP